MQSYRAIEGDGAILDEAGAAGGRSASGIEPRRGFVPERGESEEYGPDVCDVDDCGFEEEAVCLDEDVLEEAGGAMGPDRFCDFDAPEDEDGPLGPECGSGEGDRSVDPCSLSPKELGRKGEEAACELLKRKDYVILERNWSCPAGEADIIAMDGDCLVFVEVKTRAGVERGLPEDAVTPRKRARYERIAGFFLSDYDGPDSRVRFDVIGVLALSGGRALARHVVNAFGAGD